LLGDGGFGQDWLLHDMRTCWVLPHATRAEASVPAQACGRSVPVAPRWVPISTPVATFASIATDATCGVSRCNTETRRGMMEPDG
jgi:hypothetical protein